SRYLLQLLRQREGIRQRPLPLVVVFFFSSRRRDTSSKRDWSSDVCSSDLLDAAWGNSHEEIYILGEWKRGKRKRHPSVISTADEIGRASCREREWVPRDAAPHVEVDRAERGKLVRALGERADVRKHGIRRR